MKKKTEIPKDAKITILFLLGVLICGVVFACFLMTVDVEGAERANRWGLGYAELMFDSVSYLGLRLLGGVGSSADMVPHLIDQQRESLRRHFQGGNHERIQTKTG